MLSFNSSQNPDTISFLISCLLLKPLISSSLKFWVLTTIQIVWGHPLQIGKLYHMHYPEKMKLSILSSYQQLPITPQWRYRFQRTILHICMKLYWSHAILIPAIYVWVSHEMSRRHFTALFPHHPALPNIFCYPCTIFLTPDWRAVNIACLSTAMVINYQYLF